MSDKVSNFLVNKEPEEFTFYKYNINANPALIIFWLKDQD